VAAVATAAQAAVRDLGGDAEEAAEIEIEYPGVKDRYGSPEEFLDAAPGIDVEQVENVRIYVHAHYSAAEKGRIYVRLSREGSAVYMTIEGTNRRWVDGTQAELVELLGAGRKWPHSERWALVLGAIAIVGDVLALAASATWLKLAGLLMFICFGATAAAGAGWLGKLFPQMELLPADREPRGARLARTGRRGLSTIILLTVGAVISAIVSHVWK
jgi:hypothetical protein